VIISGDSGVGKTSVQDEIVERFDGVAPAPVKVAHAPAALQAALLDSLGDAAALIVHAEGTARQVAASLSQGVAAWREQRATRSA
jgi:hypothetical protein